MPLSKMLDTLVNIMRRLASLCLLGMALVTGADVVGRASGHPVFGSEEIVTILATLAVACSLPYAHVERSHIGVEIFMRRMGRRARNAVSLCTHAASLALFGLISWRMSLYGLDMRASGERSMNLELPEYLVVFVLALGFAVCTVCLARDVARIVRGEEV